MEHYDVYQSRSGLCDSAIAISRGHAKLKRDKVDLGSTDPKASAPKIARQSSAGPDGAAMLQQRDSSTMNVLPRLLRTVTNGNGRDGNASLSAHVSELGNSVAAPEHEFQQTIASLPTPTTDTDSSSSASSFHSTPSSVPNSSSIISFLTPGQLGPVAAMAAALSAPNNMPTSTLDNSEPSGLVTLATASSMVEKEWLARTAVFAGESPQQHNTDSTGVHHMEAAQPANELITLAVEHGSDSNLDASPPLLFRTLTSSAPHSQLNGSTPVTRAVLNVQSLAVLLRETQKQRSTSAATMDSPLGSNWLPVSSDSSHLGSVGNDNRLSLSSQIVPPATANSSVVSSMNSAPHSAAGTTDHQSVDHNAGLTGDCEGTDSGSLPPAAFISIQPAPGSLMSSSDLQQLMASGEFMSSAARQTLLGQSPDGTTRQLYLLVPSDCPVIMPRASASQSSATMTPHSPVLNSSSSGAPILEAISPGVEQDENCNPHPPAISSAVSPQPVTVALPQLANAVLAPMSSTSTALSTLIAGFEARNQSSQQSRYSTAATAAPSTSPSSWSRGAANSGQLPDASRIRLPIQLPGVTLSDHSILTTDQSSYPAVSVNGIGTLLGAVKSDPDMYTPNGHPYTTLVDDVNRFRPYPPYTQSGSHEVQVAASRNAPLTAPSTTGIAFFQPDLAASVVPPQRASMTTNIRRNGSGNSGVPNSSNGIGDLNIGAHLLGSAGTLPRVNATFNSGCLSSGVTSTSGVSLVPTNSKMASPSLDECRRNMASTLLAAGNAVRSEQGSTTTYLEHLNPESKDIRRRVSHNEVERRRRDRINTWISELYKLLPPDEQAKSQYQSKGIVLKRVCEYFQNVDSMLKTANAAVEQARVENDLLRQRNRELQQENQLLSASLHLGAAAAAAHLKNRQPRMLTTLHPDESSSGPTEGGSHMLRESSDGVDYPSSVTVFAVNSNADYNNGASTSSGVSEFNQTSSSACLGPMQQSPSSTNFPVLSNSSVFTLHGVASSSGTAVVSPTASMIRPLTLPSLDLVANHTDSRPE